jgi:hypothetical protein
LDHPLVAHASLKVPRAISAEAVVAQTTGQRAEFNTKSLPGEGLGRVKRQQGGADQGDLFDEALRAALRDDANGEGSTGPEARPRSFKHAWHEIRNEP